MNRHLLSRPCSPVLCSVSVLARALYDQKPYRQGLAIAAGYSCFVRFPPCCACVSPFSFQPHTFLNFSQRGLRSTFQPRLDPWRTSNTTINQARIPICVCTRTIRGVITKPRWRWARSRPVTEVKTGEGGDGANSPYGTHPHSKAVVFQDRFLHSTY